MDNPKLILFAVLSAVTVWFIICWAKRFARTQNEDTTDDRRHTPFHAVVAFICTFFDTLGIGNFAPTASAFKFRGSVPDENIPGTLNVGYAIPTIAQAFIFVGSVDVDTKTLMLMITCAVTGAWLGAKFVTHWSRKTIQLGIGVALLAAAGLMTMRQLELIPAGGEARVAWSKARSGPDGHFLFGSVDDFGDRTVRAVSDPRELVGNERDHGISHHDGFVRLSDADGWAAVHSRRPLRC